MSDILEDLLDLEKQATTERSHYYVAACARRAIVEIARLRSAVDKAGCILVSVKREANQ